MRIALRAAERALDHDDVPVGCVIARDQEVIGAAPNERELRADPTAHAELLALRDELVGSLENVEATVTLFRAIELPDFVRETEFVSLQGNGDYPFIGGRMVSTDGVVLEEDQYRAMTNEYVDDRNTSKLCRLSRSSFAVGALARVNNNRSLLAREAAELASDLGLDTVCHNPFMNNAAQLVECVHVVCDAIRLIDELVELSGTETRTPVTVRAGEGIAAIEAPRGILYHHYEYDGQGRVVRANCVIPTTQNNKNIHLDIGALVEAIKDQDGMTDQTMELLCSMLVRAYDPCISCSVH